MAEPLRKLPDFFIVGAPKCGTTSLARYLAEHPRVYITNVKEPSYFARSMVTEWEAKRSAAYQLDLDSYLQLFQPATDEQTRRGEATTRYLRSETALREIKTLCPDARLIVMLRDPVAMVESWHAQKLWERQETEPVFESAWRLEESRRRGDDLPRRLKATDALFYSQIARLGTQVERLLQIFPQEQVRLILLDDLVRDARRVYQDTLQFLGIPDDGRTNFAVHNPRRRLIANRVLSALHLASPRMPTGNTSPAFAIELRRSFAPEVAKLERILGRDLSAWKDPVQS